jgi:hypothetical protein
MALKKLIEKPDEKDVEKARQDFIKGAGLVAADNKQPSTDEWTRIVLRIRGKAINQIDRLISNTMGVTRTGWILQAIEEKLKRSEHE